MVANMPGGLELLPNKHYKDNIGNAAWLHVPLKDGTIKSFPQSGDPYKEIYQEERDVFWRMVNPAWLDPGGTSAGSTTIKKEGPWDNYKYSINQAKAFNGDLTAKRPWNHGRTYQFYSTGSNTVDRIEFSRQNCTLGPQVQLDGMFVEADASPLTRGRYTAYVDKYDQLAASPESVVQVVSMAMPKDCGSQGDGTLSDSSGTALECTTFKVKKVEHQDFYESGDAKKYVFDAVWNFAQCRITQEVGPAQK
jgi:hypothetical protein